MKHAFQSHWVLVFFLLCGGYLHGEDSTPDVENSLGMRFEAIGENGLFISVWETRVRDYQAFVDATQRRWVLPDFEQGPNHPAVRVSWGDAVAFCRWLTLHEQQEGRLPEGMRYRLPKSAEWDQAAGLTDPDATNLYLWGSEWPPPLGAGNFHPDLLVDSFPTTAPVGSFPPNANGLYDLSGNVWEWCADPFNEALDFRILRGASWRMRTPSDLQIRFRVGNVMSLRLDTYGFRVVLDTGKDKETALKVLRESSDDEEE